MLTGGILVYGRNTVVHAVHMADRFRPARSGPATAAPAGVRMVSTMAQDNKPATGIPLRGSMIVYIDGLGQDGRERYRIAEVTGPTVPDPITGNTWTGVLLPDKPGMVEMIDCTYIVNVVPPR